LGGNCRTPKSRAVPPSIIAIRASGDARSDRQVNNSTNGFGDIGELAILAAAATTCTSARRSSSATARTDNFNRIGRRPIWRDCKSTRTRGCDKYYLDSHGPSSSFLTAEGQSSTP
jgi:hypothetical protein